MDNLTDDQLDDMLLDKRLQEARAKEDVSADTQIPYQPGKAPAPERSYLESLGRGAAQGYTSGTSDELTGAAESALTGKDYKTARNESRKEYGAASEANPKMYGLGMLGGGALQMATPGLNVLGKAGPVLSGMAQGALSGYGMSESDDPTQQAKDAAFGGAIGGAVGKAADYVGKTKLGKYISNLAEQRAYKASAGQSVADLTREAKAGRVSIDREGMSIARGRDLLSKDEAGKPVVGWFDRTENIAPKAEAKREAFGGMISDLAKNIDQAHPEGAISAEELRSIIQREMADRVGTTGNDRLTAQLNAELDRVLGDKAAITFSDAQKYKNAFQWKPSKNVSAPQEYEFQTTLHNAFSEAMEKAAERASGKVAGAEKYPYLKGKYASYRGAAEQGEKRAVQNQTNRVIAPTDYYSGGTMGAIISGAAGTGAGAVASGGNPMIATAAGIGGALVHKAVRERGSAFAARSADLVAKALEAGDKAFGKFAPILNEAMSRGTTNFILTHNLLMQSNPEYQNAVSSISE
jgi:hypothetical protein